MCLDELPDLALLRVFSNCNTEDISSLQRTNWKLHNHIAYYRVYYSKFKIYNLEIKKTDDGQYKIRVDFDYTKGVIKAIPAESLKRTIESLNPAWLVSDDIDIIANMSRLWWKDRTKVSLKNNINYQKYLPHIDRCTMIALECALPVSLTEVLQSMETKTLKWFSLKGDIECTDEDIRKIGRLSDELSLFELKNVNESSNISIDAILDMIEIGSLGHGINIKISRIQHFENIEEIARKRSWVDSCNKFKPNKIKLKLKDGRVCYIVTRN